MSERGESDAAPTIAPTVVDQGGAPIGRFSRPKVDLTNDRILERAPRLDFDGFPTPSLGGIPLIAKIGQGGMGAVYLGYKTRLDHEVAVKVLPLELAVQDSNAVERFLREARLAARIQSPHLVNVTDVGDEAGLFYLVMDFVRGTSARTLAHGGGSGAAALSEAQALDLVIAATKGLAAAHDAGVIHRDVKPDNILVPIDADGNVRLDAARLADLGLARPEASNDKSLTGASWSMGTPGYMAPEQAMSAKEATVTADVFSMGATLYALLVGRAPFIADTPTATVLKTIQEDHQPLTDFRADLSPETIDLVDRCLAKNAVDRPEDGIALLAELEAIRAELPGDHADLATVRNLDVGRIAPTPTPRRRSNRSAPGAKPATRTLAAPVGANKRRAWIAGAAGFVVLLLIGWVVTGPRSRPDDVAAVVTKTKIVVATGSEKAEWMSAAALAFAKTEAGAAAEVEIVPMPAEDAAEAIVGGKRKIVAWSPSSGLFFERLKRLWKAAGRDDLAPERVTLALSPMVIAMFESRRDALVKRYGAVSFTTLHDALKAGGTWQAIAERPDWGNFTFSMTDPTKHSSGLSSLVLIAAEFAKKDRTLEVADVSTPAFDAWGKDFAGAFRAMGAADLSMREMVLKGPGAFDGVLTYENIAIDSLDDAVGRVEALKLDYPRVNLWNDHPIYLFGAPIASDAETAVARRFAAYLTAEHEQRELVMRGFRPGNPRVPILFPESPFKKHADCGVRIEIPIVLDPPEASVIETLLERAGEWQAKR